MSISSQLDDKLACVVALIQLHGKDYVQDSLNRNYETGRMTEEQWIGATESLEKLYLSMVYDGVLDEPVTVH